MPWRIIPEARAQAPIKIKKSYHEHPVRYEYRLTQKGLDLWPVLVALLQWGDRHALGGEPPMIITHRGCGGELDDRRRCTVCGADVTVTQAAAVRTGAGRIRAGAASA